MKKRLPDIWVALLLAAGSLWLYAPALKCDFVDYDDPVYVTENPWVLQGITPGTVRAAFRERVSGNWHPLTMLSHLLDVSLFGVKPAGHHAHNLLLHAANVALLYGVLRALTGARWPSAVVAALFAAHPLNVESVAWISERKNLVSTFWWLAAIGAHAGQAKKTGRGPALATLAAFVLALAAKPMPVTLPFTLLLLDVWPLRRVDGFGPSAWKTWRELLAEKLPLFVLVPVFMITTVQTQMVETDILLPLRLSLGARVLQSAVHAGHYLRLFFWPSGLCALYPRAEAAPDLGAALPVLLGFLALTIFFFLSARRRPWLIVGWLWFLGVLVPVIGVVPVGFQGIADRYLYVPMIGLLLAVAWTIRELAGSRAGRWIAVGLAAAGLTAEAVVTRRQISHWENSEALFRRAVTVTRNNFVMHYNLGRQLLLQERLDEALGQFREAIRIRPDYFLAQNNVGWTLMLQGRNEEALPHLQESLRLEPSNAQARMNLAVALARLGRFAEARDEFGRLLEQVPDYPGAREGYRQAALRAR